MRVDITITEVEAMTSKNKKIMPDAYAQSKAAILLEVICKSEPKDHPSAYKPSPEQIRSECEKIRAGRSQIGSVPR